MSFDLAGLAAAVAAQGVVARVVIASAKGSAPRETGAAMLVWASGQSGTIGGGALEFAAAARARAMLGTGGARLDRQALGPDLGQCCGGAVALLTEVWDGPALAAVIPQAGVWARPIGDAGGPPPLAVRRLLNRARAGMAADPAPVLVQGWMVEHVRQPGRALWVWGAGHVGRAVVAVLAPLPEFALTWVDTGVSRFPDHVPAGVAARTAPNPADLAGLAPATAEHLILTYSHALDLELCHRLLLHGHGGIGLIGSASKWARFRTRLRALGHADAHMAGITCPIGEPALGKHPQAIALGVGAALLRQTRVTAGMRETAG